jgi:hypothetical protein
MSLYHFKKVQRSKLIGMELLARRGMNPTELQNLSGNNNAMHVYEIYRVSKALLNHRNGITQNRAMIYIREYINNNLDTEQEYETAQGYKLPFIMMHWDMMEQGMVYKREDKAKYDLYINRISYLKNPSMFIRFIYDSDYLYDALSMFINREPSMNIIYMIEYILLLPAVLKKIKRNYPLFYKDMHPYIDKNKSCIRVIYRELSGYISRLNYKTYFLRFFDNTSLLY